MAFRGTAIDGVATADGDSMGLPFTGALAGTAITIQAPSLNGYTMHGTGTLNPTTHHVSGRYNIDLDGPTPTPADSGAWSGDLVTPHRIFRSARRFLGEALGSIPAPLSFVPV